MALIEHLKRQAEQRQRGGGGGGWTRRARRVRDDGRRRAGRTDRPLHARAAAVGHRHAALGGRAVRLHRGHRATGDPGAQPGRSELRDRVGLSRDDQRPLRRRRLAVAPPARGPRSQGQQDTMGGRLFVRRQREAGQAGRGSQAQAGRLEPARMLRRRQPMPRVGEVAGLPRPLARHDRPSNGQGRVARQPPRRRLDPRGGGVDRLGRRLRRGVRRRCFRRRRHHVASRQQARHLPGRARRLDARLDARRDRRQAGA